MAYFNCDWLSINQQHDPLLGDYSASRVLKLLGSRIRVERYDSMIQIDDMDSIDFDISGFDQVMGSYVTSIRVRMIAGKVEVQGNPSAWNRLDNVFGYSLDESIQVYNEILRSLGLPEFTTGSYFQYYSQSDCKFRKSYDGAKITRVDYCTNLSVGLGNVSNFHKFLSLQKLYKKTTSNENESKILKWDYNTVYLNDSKFWLNVKSYDKSNQIQSVLIPQIEKKYKDLCVAGHITKPQCFALIETAQSYLLQLATWCAEVGLSRLEYSFRNRFFKQNDGFGDYSEQTQMLHLEKLKENFEMLENRMCKIYQQDSRESLTNSEDYLLKLWSEGIDLMASGRVKKSQFYNVRKSILTKTGFDIGSKPKNLINLNSKPVYFRVNSLLPDSMPDFYQMPVLSFLRAA